MNNSRIEYQLNVRLTIQEMDAYYTDDQGATVNPDEVKKDDKGYYWIRPSDGERFPIRRQTSYRGSNNTLTVEDSTELGTKDFMGVMGVLGGMHNMIKAINE